MNASANSERALLQVFFQFCCLVQYLLAQLFHFNCLVVTRNFPGITSLRKSQMGDDLMSKNSARQVLPSFFRLSFPIHFCFLEISGEGV